MERWTDFLGRKSGAILLIGIFLIAGMGVATAAVSGNFTSSYDGYNDGSSTDVRGHEIQASGSIEFSGENAVDPQIIIRPSENTVIDDSSVELLQPGGTSINFNREQAAGGVRYTADEIPSGSEFNINFVAYPVSGLTESEIKSAEVVVRYERPGGGTERKTIDVTTSLSNSPQQVINSQENEERIGLLMQGLAVIGGLAVLLIVLMGAYSAYSRLGKSGPPSGPPGN